LRGKEVNLAKSRAEDIIELKVKKEKLEINKKRVMEDLELIK
jgi:hypothetical protein